MPTKTTDEMDGLLTEKDIQDKYKAYIFCIICGNWQYLNDYREDYKACNKCGSSKYDPNSCISVRTFDPVRAAKRKVKK